MKSLIKLLVLSLSCYEMSSIGINIYYKSSKDMGTGMAIYNSFQHKGIPIRLISLIKKEKPCSMTYENSFIDLCIGEKNEMKIIRKTSWLHESLKPLVKKGLEKPHAL